MNNNKKFSIIVITLNTKKDFLKTINSVLSQKYSHYELIVVDGNSADGTIEEINKLKKKFSKIIIGKDKGIYDAMNKGIRFINNDWVIFLNSGDIFYNKDVLKKINSEIHLKKKIDVLVGRNIVGSKIKYYSKFKKINSKTFKSVFSHQSVFFRSSLFLKKKYNLKFKIAADFEFFKYLIKKNKRFYYTDIIFSLSKIGGISDRNRVLALNEFYMIAQNYNNNTLAVLIEYIFNYIFLFLTKFIKLISPKKLNLLILKIKYRNYRL